MIQNLDEIKEKNLEMLCDFDEFCRKNNIEYNIAFGTLLGAVRHQGFIPWDDDIDVDMSIDNYIKFEKIWKKEGNKNKYFLQTKKSDPNLFGGFSRLRMNKTTSMDKIGLTLPMHWGLPLDIFTYYNAPKSKFGKNLMERSFHRYVQFCGYIKKHPKSVFLGKISVIISFLLNDYLCLISNWCRNNPEIFFACGYIDKKRFFEKEIIIPAKDILFEGKALMGPNCPEKYLELQYGDYHSLPPEEVRVCHPTLIVDLHKDYREYLEGNFVE